MPNWPIHIIVPLLAPLIVSRKEHQKYILMLLPLAVVPDFDTFVTQHRALLHNIFLPLILFTAGYFIKENRAIFFVAGVYLASHVFMDMFDGGVVLLYPLFNEMAFIDASLKMTQANELIWTFDYGFSDYGSGWKNAYGYISDSIGTGAITFVFLAGVCIAYRKIMRRG